MSDSKDNLDEHEPGVGLLPPGSVGLRQKWQRQLEYEANLCANPQRGEDRPLHFLAVELIERFLRDLSQLEQST